MIVESLQRHSFHPAPVGSFHEFMPPRHASRLKTARTLSTGRVIAVEATCNCCRTSHPPERQDPEDLGTSRLAHLQGGMTKAFPS